MTSQEVNELFGSVKMDFCKSKYILLAIFMVVTASFISFALAENRVLLLNAGLTGLEVPDATSLNQTMLSILDRKIDGDNNYYTYSGLVFIYSLMNNELFENYFSTNIVLLLVATVALVNSVYSRSGDIGLIKFGLIISSFLFNPYLLLVIGLPNKEILVFAFINIAIYF